MAQLYGLPMQVTGGQSHQSKSRKVATVRGTLIPAVAPHVLAAIVMATIVSLDTIAPHRSVIRTHPIAQAGVHSTETTAPLDTQMVTARGIPRYPGKIAQPTLLDPLRASNPTVVLATDVARLPTTFPVIVAPVAELLARPATHSTLESCSL